MTSERTELVEELLMQAVYRSRARKAAGVGPAVRLDQPAGPGTCGLGERAAVELDLGQEERDLLARIWPTPPDAPGLARIRDLLAEWVRFQDGLDRKRNHYLRDFRRAHGFERSDYPPGVLAAFESGLERVNSEETAARRARAQELLASVP